MTEHEEAAAGVAPESRPEIERQPTDSTPSAIPAQVETVRVWRITRRPHRIGLRGRDLTLARFNGLDQFRQQSDYLWLFHPDGRALFIAEGGYAEMIRRAAYGHAPVIDPLGLDDLRAAEDAAWAAGARHG